MALNVTINSCIKSVARFFGKDVYAEDALVTTHNHDFLKDLEFEKAYARGIKASGSDYCFRWRVHVALWVASSASKLGGDFVECGVNHGFVSSAIMASLDWNSLSKRFFLLDTFQGLDNRFVSEAEKRVGYLERNQENLSSNRYASKIEVVRQNFSEWKNVTIVQGSVPETLGKVDSNKIAFLHLDMNCSFPEVEALKFFWSKLVPGGFVLLDDYAYVGFQLSKEGMDRLASVLGVRILALPTGQGLIVRPPN